MTDPILDAETTFKGIERRDHAGRAMFRAAYAVGLAGAAAAATADAERAPLWLGLAAGAAAAAWFGVRTYEAAGEKWRRWRSDFRWGGGAEVAAMARLALLAKPGAAGLPVGACAGADVRIEERTSILSLARNKDASMRRICAQSGDPAIFVLAPGDVLPEAPEGLPCAEIDFEDETSDPLAILLPHGEEPRKRALAKIAEAAVAAARKAQGGGRVGDAEGAADEVVAVLCGSSGYEGVLASGAVALLRGAGVQVSDSGLSAAVDALSNRLPSWIVLRLPEEPTPAQALRASLAIDLLAANPGRRKAWEDKTKMLRIVVERPQRLHPPETLLAGASFLLAGRISFVLCMESAGALAEAWGANPAALALSACPIRILRAGPSNRLGLPAGEEGCDVLATNRPSIAPLKLAP